MVQPASTLSPFEWIRQELEEIFYPDGVDEDAQAEVVGALLPLLKEWKDGSNQFEQWANAQSKPEDVPIEMLIRMKSGIVNEAHGFLTYADFRPRRRRRKIVKVPTPEPPPALRADGRYFNLYRKARKKMIPDRRKILGSDKPLTPGEALRWFQDSSETGESVGRLFIEVEISRDVANRAVKSGMKSWYELVETIGEAPGSIRFLGGPPPGTLVVSGKRVDFSKPRLAQIGWAARELTTSDLVASFPWGVWFVLTGVWNPPPLDPVVHVGRPLSLKTMVAGLCWIEAEEGNHLTTTSDPKLPKVFVEYWNRLAPSWGLGLDDLTAGNHIRLYIKRARKVEAADLPLFRKALRLAYPLGVNGTTEPDGSIASSS